MNILTSRGRMNIAENVTWLLRDAHGKVKPIFVWNALGRQLFKLGTITPFNKNPLLGTWVHGPVTISNLVTNTGFAAMASRLNGSGSEAAFTYVAIGTGATAAAVTDTALQAEITTNGGGRGAATVSRTTTTVTNDTARLIITWSFSGSLAITESGILNAASSGVLATHQVFSAVNVVNGESLQATWDIDFAGA